jgi:SAM-dependent methyltransferase
VLRHLEVQQLERKSPPRMGNMTGNWDGSAQAEGFADYDDSTKWVFGYPALLKRTGVGSGGVRSVVEWGCGPGKAARYLAEAHGVRVTAVDASVAMIDLARRHHAHPLVDFRVTGPEQLDFLPDAGVDAAIACFVLCEISESEPFAAILDETRRILRPGGRFTILQPHPGSSGIQFATFRNGEPGVAYKQGDRWPGVLRQRGGSLIEIDDFFWAEDHVCDLMRFAGFVDLTVDEPVLADVDPAALPDPADFQAHAWQAERAHPPFQLITGTVPAP